MKTGFFRDGGDSRSTGSVGDNVDGKTTINITFDGKWLHKKHQYNKDQGLMSNYAIKPVQSAKARLMLYYEIGINWYRQLTPYCTTNDTGGFTISYGIDASAVNCKAYPVIYPSGPNPGSPKINVSDPNITLPAYWKDLNDPTLYPMLEKGIPTYHIFYANTTPKHLGTIWTDTFPAVTQPQSGCINIYETLLKGYNKLVPTYTSSSILTVVRAMWEPAYFPVGNSSFYRRDSIYVMGDVLSVVGTDEWDDMVLLHEYGHHVQNICATIPIAGGVT